jgi:hypothetical protein
MARPFRACTASPARGCGCCAALAPRTCAYRSTRRSRRTCNPTARR